MYAQLNVTPSRFDLVILEVQPLAELKTECTFTHLINKKMTTAISANRTMTATTTPAISPALSSLAVDGSLSTFEALVFPWSTVVVAGVWVGCGTGWGEGVEGGGGLHGLGVGVGEGVGAGVMGGTFKHAPLLI